jgi:Holliday junction resolvase RusA-like endonuclease
MKLTLFVPGEPVGKGRPRASVRAGRPHLRTPNRTRDYEALVATLARPHARQQGWTHAGEPVALQVTVVHRRPKRPPKGHPCHGHDGRAWFVSRPDLSNVIKAIEDGLEGGGALSDDSCVVQYHEPVQVYGAVGEAVGVHVRLTMLGALS